MRSKGFNKNLINIAYENKSIFSDKLFNLGDAIKFFYFKNKQK